MPPGRGLRVPWVSDSESYSFHFTASKPFFPVFGHSKGTCPFAVPSCIEELRFLNALRRQWSVTSNFVFDFLPPGQNMHAQNSGCPFTAFQLPWWVFYAFCCMLQGSIWKCWSCFFRICIFRFMRLAKTFLKTCNTWRPSVCALSLPVYQKVLVHDVGGQLYSLIQWNCNADVTSCELGSTWPLEIMPWY